MKATFVLILCVLLFPTIIHCSELPSDKLVQELYTKSGMEIQIKQVPFLMITGMKQEASKQEHITKAEMKALEQAVQKYYSPDYLKLKTQELLKKKLSRATIKDVIKWLDTPLGKKITRFEEKASTPEAVLEMQNFIQKFSGASAPPDDRVRITEKICKATKAAEFSAQLICDIQLSIANAFAVADKSENYKKFEAFKKQIESGKPHMIVLMKEQMNLSYLYVYRLLTVPELTEYYNFISTESGIKYSNASPEIITKVMLLCSNELGKFMVTLFKKHEKKK
ncbi:hypothetical protein KAJ27_03090 [bacterium]|nr:hypothetical protein [bacterium]